MKEKASNREKDTRAEQVMSELTEKALKNCEQAVRTGLKLQEEAVVWWTKLINQTTVGQDWQKPLQTVTCLADKIMPEAQKRMEEVLGIIGLREQRGLLAKALSHGQKQWLEIGMLLMQDPELLLVDEPVAGMTPQEIERTAELLNSLAGDHSVVVVEHDMAFVRSIARRVAVLHEGAVIAEGDMDAVQSNSRVIEVYLGE